MKRESRLEKLQALAKRKCDDPFSRYALALEYRNEGMTDDALKEFQSLVANWPDYVPVYYQYGVLLAELTHIEQARAVLSQGIAIAEKQGEEHARDELVRAVDQL